MSLEINSIVLGGNLTRDVELKETTTGRKVCTFTVAANSTFVSGGEKRQETSFIDVDVWGPMAENCSKYLSKGSPVVVTGRLKQEQWQNDAGEKRSRIKIVAANVQFLPSKNRPAETATAGVSEGSGWEE